MGTRAGEVSVGSESIKRELHTIMLLKHITADASISQ